LGRVGGFGLLVVVGQALVVVSWWATVGVSRTAPLTGPDGAHAHLADKLLDSRHENRSVDWVDKLSTAAWSAGLDVGCDHVGRAGGRRWDQRGCASLSA